MKLKDILTKETYEKWGDMDVTNDVSDDLSACWCGTLLTEYGKSVYKDVLELEAEIRPVWGCAGISVNVDRLGDGWEKAWNKADAFFTDMAGYIDEDEYNKRFTDGEEESTEEEEPKYRSGIPVGNSEEDSLERIEKLEYLLGNALDWILEHINEEDIPSMLERVGYEEEYVKQYAEELMQ